MMAPASPPPPPWRWQADATAGLASPSPGYGAPGGSPGGGIGDGGGRATPGGGGPPGVNHSSAPSSGMGIGLLPAAPAPQAAPPGGGPAPGASEGNPGPRPLIFGAEESNSAWKHVKTVIGDDGKGAPDLQALLAASPLEGGYAFHQAGVSLPRGATAVRSVPPSLRLAVPAYLSGLQCRLRETCMGKC